MSVLHPAYSNERAAERASERAVCPFVVRRFVIHRRLVLLLSAKGYSVPHSPPTRPPLAEDEATATVRHRGNEPQLRANSVFVYLPSAAVAADTADTATSNATLARLEGLI